MGAVCPQRGISEDTRTTNKTDDWVGGGGSPGPVANAGTAQVDTSSTAESVKRRIVFFIDFLLFVKFFFLPLERNLVGKKVSTGTEG